MQLAENLIIDVQLQSRIDSEKLTVSDRLLLALAGYSAERFPEATIYIGAQRQGVTTPAVFVDYYSIGNQQRLARDTAYEFGFVITYVPVDQLSVSELSHAILNIQQDLHRLPWGSGQEFCCYSKSADITDGLANVTGTVMEREAEAPTEPLINKAQKELNT